MMPVEDRREVRQRQRHVLLQRRGGRTPPLCPPGSTPGRCSARSLSAPNSSRPCERDGLGRRDARRALARLAASSRLNIRAPFLPLRRRCGRAQTGVIEEATKRALMLERAQRRGGLRRFPRQPKNQYVTGDLHRVDERDHSMGLANSYIDAAMDSSHIGDNHA